MLEGRISDRKSQKEVEREMGEKNKNVASALVDRLRASSFGAGGQGQ
jgi:hypothetical protein